MSDKRNVLLIDGDPIVCEETQKALQEMGYGVTAVSNGEAAHNIFRDEQQKVDIVLIDVIRTDDRIGPFLAFELHRIRPDALFLLYTDLALEYQILNTRVIRAIVPKSLTKQELSMALEEVFLKKVLPR